MSFLKLFFPNKKRKPIQRKPKNARRANLRVENLEDRVVPAGTITLTPNIFTDPAMGVVNPPGGVIPNSGGAISLRSAIQAINSDTSGDQTAVINLSSGEYIMSQPQQPGVFDTNTNGAGGNTNDNQAGDFTISPPSSFSNIIINGAANGGTTVDAFGLDRIFHILPNSNDLTVTFNNVVLQHGLAGPHVGNPNAVPPIPADPGVGGAIYFDDAGEPANFDHLIVNGSILQNNAADGGGGAIYAATASVTMFSDIVENNTTAGSGGGVALQFGTFKSTGTFYTANLAQGNGGGIWLGGPTNLQIIIDSSGLSDNVAGGVGGGYYDNNTGSLLFRSGSFADGNSSDLSGSATPGGGGLLIHDHTFTMTGGQVSGNHTAGDGGGIDDLSNSNGSMTITSSDISNNTAGEDGGGVANGDASTGSVTGATTVTLTSDFFQNDYAGGHGGGFSDAASTQFTADGDVVNQNYASFGGGGFYLDSSSGTYNLGDTAGLSITNNRAGSFSGGGGIDNPVASVLFDLEQSFVLNNVAGHGGGVATRANIVTVVNGNLFFDNIATTGNGGGLYNDPSATTTINNDTFNFNVAGGNGGGIYSNAISVTVNGMQDIFNTAEGSGGGMEFDGQTLKINPYLGTNAPTVITGNFAAVNGAGLNADLATGTSDTSSSPYSVTIKGADIVGNRAGNTGGGVNFIASTYSTLYVTNTLIQFNVAGDPGGGVATDGQLNTFIFDVVTYNSTTEGGGGFDLISNPADTGTGSPPIYQISSITQSYIANNQAGGGGDGGGILASTNTNSYLEVVNDTIEFNTAGQHGGGIANEGGTQTDALFDTIKSNLASQGGGIYNSATGTRGSVTTALAVGLGNDIFSGNAAAPDLPLEGPNTPANTGKNGYAIFGLFSDALYTPAVAVAATQAANQGPNGPNPANIVGHNYIDAIGTGQVGGEPLLSQANGDFLVVWTEYNTSPWQGWMSPPGYHGGPLQPPGFWTEVPLVDSSGDCLNQAIGEGIINAVVQAFFGGPSGVVIDQVGNHRPITPGNAVNIGAFEVN